MSSIQQPVACTLPGEEANRQVGRWAYLQAATLISELVDGGVAMTFPIGMAEDVEDLAARERSCCGFLTITTTRDADRVRLEITSENPAAAPVIESLTGVGRR